MLRTLLFTVSLSSDFFLCCFVELYVRLDSPSSEESEDSDDDNFVGVGGKWEFLGEPSKTTAKRKFYNVSYLAKRNTGNRSRVVFHQGSSDCCECLPHCS
jgi:hypothetical protein